MTDCFNSDVSIIKLNTFSQYPENPPFDPSENFSEYLYHHFISSTQNVVYSAIRQSLVNLGLDRENINAAQWSPFCNLIQPGNTVVIKPNLVLDVEQNQEAVTTHGSVIRPVIDYVWKALKGKGSILVFDAPQAEADFDEIVRRNGLAETISILRNRGVNVFLEDIRALKVTSHNDIFTNPVDLAGGRLNSIIIDLKDKSAFNDLEFNINKISGGTYGRFKTINNHSKNNHKYCVSRKILEADVVISVPKLKTHKKAGLTCCMKNLVGINVDKNYLPHFSVGPANSGGDEFPRIAVWRLPALFLIQKLRDFLLHRFWRYTSPIIAFVMGIGNVFNKKSSKQKYGQGPAYKFYKILTGVNNYQGSWQGNETIWRMILDLNKIFLYADKRGQISDKTERKIFYVVDGFISGAGNGPMMPTPVYAGFAAVGYNAYFIDYSCLLVAGINPLRIPLYREAADNNLWLHQNNKLSLKINNENIDADEKIKIIELHPPDNWVF